MDGIRWIRVTVDTVVSMVGVLVYAVIVTPVANNDGATLYDDRTAVTNNPKVKIFGNKDDTKDIHFAGGMDFQRGLYIDVETEGTEVVIGFVPLGPGAL